MNGSVRVVQGELPCAGRGNKEREREYSNGGRREMGIMRSCPSKGGDGVDRVVEKRERKVMM
jgi:hypothetical protein